MKAQSAQNRPHRHVAHRAQSGFDFSRISSLNPRNFVQVQLPQPKLPPPFRDQLAQVRVLGDDAERRAHFGPNQPNTRSHTSAATSTTSGTTIIAAEMMNRYCLAIELAPNYVDVAVQRWQTFAKSEATLEGDGRTFAEIAKERLGQ
jgi:hypothetical protein